MKKKFVLTTIFLISISNTVLSQVYVTPPTSSTRGYVPVISDEQMQHCVKLYNETEWLAEKINQTHVDSFSQTSVDNYNQMVSEHTRMTNQFNAECAGKQSRSACEAVKKLNLSQGLPHQEC